MRLIDGDALLRENSEFADAEFIHPRYQYTLRDLVDDAEVIDAVPIVRCRDCWLHGKFPRCPMVDIDCTGHGFIDKSIDDGFCNFGKRNGVYEQ